MDKKNSQRILPKQCSFSSQPLENPANKEHLWSTLEAMNAKETLMFASDYPHWDQDEISALRLPKEWHENIFGLNALNTYERLSHLRPTKSSNGATTRWKRALNGKKTCALHRQ